MHFWFKRLGISPGEDTGESLLEIKKKVDMSDCLTGAPTLLFIVLNKTLYVSET
jgi:hypothetical protein